MALLHADVEIPALSFPGQGERLSHVGGPTEEEEEEEAGKAKSTISAKPKCPKNKCGY